MASSAAASSSSLAAILGAAKRAATVAAWATQHARHRVHAISKADSSPVTKADLASQAIISLLLQKELGSGVKILGEEESNELRRNVELKKEVVACVQAAEPLLAGVDLTEESVVSAIDAGRVDEVTEGMSYFTVDPIDGTKGYLLADKGGQYAVGIAYIHEGRPAVGVIACPVLPFSGGAAGAGGGGAAAEFTGSLFYATQGGGAFMQPLIYSTADCAVRLDEEKLQKAWLSAPSLPRLTLPSFLSSRSTELIMQALGNSSPSEQLDSMVKYCLLARGSSSIYLRMLGSSFAECVWDHAPGTILVQEAGGRVTDMAGKQLQWGTGRRLTANVGVVASNGSLHEPVLEAVQTAGILS